MTTTIAICRISCYNDGLRSLSTQEQILKQAAGENVIVVKIVRSAFKDFTDLDSIVQLHGATTVLTTTVDRLTRNVAEFDRLMASWAERGIVYRSVLEQLSTPDDLGRIRDLAVAAESFSKTLSLKLNAVRRLKSLAQHASWKAEAEQVGALEFLKHHTGDADLGVRAALGAELYQNEDVRSFILDSITPTTSLYDHIAMHHLKACFPDSWRSMYIQRLGHHLFKTNSKAYILKLINDLKLLQNEDVLRMALEYSSSELSRALLGIPEVQFPPEAEIVQQLVDGERLVNSLVDHPDDSLRRRVSKAAADRIVDKILLDNAMMVSHKPRYGLEQWSLILRENRAHLRAKYGKTIFTTLQMIRGFRGLKL